MVGLVSSVKYMTTTIKVDFQIEKLTAMNFSHYISIFNCFLSIFLNLTSQVVSILFFIQLDHWEDTRRTVLKQTKDNIFGLQLLSEIYFHISIFIKSSGRNQINSQH